MVLRNNFQACLAVSTTYLGMISVMASHIGALVNQYRYKMENHVLVSSEFIVIKVISLWTMSVKYRSQNVWSDLVLQEYIVIDR